MRRLRSDSGGFTLVELMITTLLLGAVAGSMLTLYISLVHSAVIAKRQAVGSTLATSQMEYLKSLPYNSLAVAGGSIYTTNPLPATTTKTINGVKYKLTTAIGYVDDSYDGCGSYPNITLKQAYCRNYPPPSGAPATDTNAADYKIIDVTVKDINNTRLAWLNTQVSARVSETASTTGALFVNVIDDNGNPVTGANVAVNNTTISPAVAVNDNTDDNGIAIFYGLPPDTAAYDYTITASLSGYSTLTTIVPNGSLQPTYSSQNILQQASSYVTLTIKPQGTNSLLLEATDPAGTPLSGVKLYVKGGYKKYTATSDTVYYYDNFTPDTRPTTDASGLLGITGLVPGNYIFCGDAGASNCTKASPATTYYLAAAVPYSGTNPFYPITVPTYLASNPPSTTFPYNAANYLQKVRLILTTSSTFPRINSITPDDVSKSTGSPSTFAFVVKGTNLPCSATAASCSTTVKFLQASSTYTASCTGSSGGTQMNCTVNLSAAAVGMTQMQVITGGNTLTMPASPLIGGINVTN